ncbi:MAG: ABC transporter ATP-binding protein [Deinococcaceae bacterium]
MLDVKDIHTYYGPIHALKGISLEVNQGEVVALIGSNGAGKSTTLRTISGMMRPKSGTLSFLGRSIVALPPHELPKLGLCHVPEGRKIFPNLTVLENLELGAYTVSNKSKIAEKIAENFEFFPRLAERQRQLGGTLSGGEQQMLAIARALMSDPVLLLLDEPSMGLSPLFVETIFDILKRLTQKGTTLLLVEQNASMAFEIAHRVYVLQTGEITQSGLSKELAQDERVRQAYLGEA